MASETESDGYGDAIEFFRRFHSGTAKQRLRLAPKAPVEAIQRAALTHGDPFVRRDCLFFLDHYANDQSMAVFAEALHDPVDFVRNAALHSLACESCKTDDLCAADVVPGLIDVLEHDRSVEMRTKVIPVLLRLSGEDTRAKPAVERSAQNDPDALIRQAAVDALTGRFVAPRKRYERHQRRHASTARRRDTA
jgi:HEAT repeat protein